MRHRKNDPIASDIAQGLLFVIEAVSIVDKRNFSLWNPRAML